MGQICATSGVCFKMHWARHVGRDLRLGMRNGEVRNHTRNFLIQSCRAHRHWTHCDSFLGLLRNSPFQAPSSRLTKTARRGGTKRKQAKIPPCLKILKANSIRNENSKSKSKGRQQALSWSKSFKQKAAWVLRKWEHFQNTEHHPPPPLWSTPIFLGNRDRSRFSQQRRTCCPCRGRPVPRVSLKLTESLFPWREKWLLQWTETQMPIKSQIPQELMTDTGRVLWAVRCSALTNISDATDASGLWTTLRAPGPGVDFTQSMDAILLGDWHPGTTGNAPHYRLLQLESTRRQQLRPRAHPRCGLLKCQRQN